MEFRRVLFRSGRLQLPGPGESGENTVPARKLPDICKSMPEGSNIEFVQDEQRMLVRSGRSRFTLSCLPSAEFPSVEDSPSDLQFSCAQQEINRLIDRTAFAMAQQEVRYYLNGMLWEVRPDHLRVVATDGHRMAMCTRPMTVNTEDTVQAILPRKGVMELSRLLDDSESGVDDSLRGKQSGLRKREAKFISRLVDGTV